MWLGEERKRLEKKGRRKTIQFSILNAPSYLFPLYRAFPSVFSGIGFSPLVCGVAAVFFGRAVEIG